MTPTRKGSVTLAEVARHAGVSVASASFVLSGRSGGGPTGSAEVQEKVRTAAAELGYTPDRTARSLRTGRTDTIVLATGDVQDPWSISLTQAVQRRGVEHGMSTLMLTDFRWFEYMIGGVFDAAMVSGVDFDPEGLSRLRRLEQVPGGVVAFSETLQPEHFDIVSSSPMPAIDDAYRRLRARHGRVHMLTTTRAAAQNLPGLTRPLQFRDTAAELGDQPLIHEMDDGVYAHLLRQCIAWLRSPDRPQAVVCHSGWFALILDAAARKVGLRTPEDLELVSIGDIPPDALQHGMITSYGVPDVFSQLAEIIVHRSLVRRDEPGAMHRFTWEFLPGTTTVDQIRDPGQVEEGTRPR